MASIGTLMSRIYNNPGNIVQESLGRDTRALTKEFKFVKGRELYRAVLRDITNPDNPFLAIEGTKRLLEIMIDEGISKNGMFLVKVSKRGSIEIVRHDFNTANKFNIITRLGIAGMCEALQVECEEVLPYMEYYRPEQGDLYRAARSVKHMIFSTRTYSGSEVIKALLKDLHRKNITAYEMYPTINAFKKYVLSGNIQDNAQYNVSMSTGVIHINIDTSIPYVKRNRVHSHKSIDQLVEEYKDIETYNTPSIRSVNE